MQAENSMDKLIFQIKISSNTEVSCPINPKITKSIPTILKVFVKSFTSFLLSSKSAGEIVCSVFIFHKIKSNND